MYSFLYSLPGVIACKRFISNLFVLWRVKPTVQEVRAYNSTNRILLSFDDFGDTETIRRLLGVLRESNTKAFFFLEGKWAKENPDIVEEIRREKHWIGNHSFSHARLTRLTDNQMEEEIKKGAHGKLLRPPFGAYDDRVRKIALTLGYRIAFWSIDSDDWRGLSAAQIQKIVWKYLHPGACVLFHINAPHTIEALPGLIEGIRARGFEVCYEGNEITI